MISIIRSAEYFEDLIAIDEYYSIEKESPGAAMDIIAGIEGAVELLKTEPYMGKVYSYRNIPTQYRFIVHSQYIIFYTFRNDEIWVVRAFDTRTDYISVLIRHYL